MKINFSVFIVVALCFSKLNWARLTPAVTSWMDIPLAFMGLHGCTTMLYKNVYYFLCHIYFKEKNKKKERDCGLLSLSSPNQSKILVALPFSLKCLCPKTWWHNKQGFFKEKQAAENPSASPILSLALNPEGLLPDSCPAKPKRAVSARVWTPSLSVLDIFFCSLCKVQANQAAAKGS